MAKATQQDDIFKEENQVTSQFVSWGKHGDNFIGTLLNVREVESRFNPGKMIKIYEFRARSGSFHGILEDKTVDADATAVVEGDIWSVGSRASIDPAMRNVKPGTIVGLRYEEDVPAKQKGYNPAKIVRIYIGGQDPNWMGEGTETLPSFNA